MSLLSLRRLQPFFIFPFLCFAAFAPPPSLAQTSPPTRKVPPPPAASCTAVIGRQITFAVVNSQDEALPYAPVSENFVSLSQNTCGNGQPLPSSCAPTDQSGQFTDTITINCAGANGPAHCGYNITDHWQWCPSSQAPVNIGTLTEIVHVDSITVNGNATPNHLPTGSHVYPQ